MAVSTPSIPFTLAQVHQLVGGELHGDGNTRLSALAGLSDANAQALSFVAHDKAGKTPGVNNAGALLVHRHLTELPVPQIVVANPQLAFAQTAQTFFVPAAAPRGIAEDLARGIDVEIGPDVSIWPFVALGDRVKIGGTVGDVLERTLLVAGS